MPALDILLDGDDCWSDLADKPEQQILQIEKLSVALRPGGMASGKASVMIRIDLPDGRTIIGLTSQELFDAAARAFRARLEYLPELRASGGMPS